MNIAPTPAPPYYAVIFTSLRTAEETGYEAMAVIPARPGLQDRLPASRRTHCPRGPP